MNLRQAVVFAILMQNQEGILGKSQSYLFEKLRACKSMQIPECLLDRDNYEIFIKYRDRWGKYNWDKEADLKIPLRNFTVDEITGEFLEK